MQRRHSVCLSDIPPEPCSYETSYEGSGEDPGKEATLSVFATRSVSTPDVPLSSSRTGTVAPVSAVPASDLQAAAAAKKKKKRNRKKEKSISHGRGNSHTSARIRSLSPLIINGASRPHPRRVNGPSDRHAEDNEDGLQRFIRAQSMGHGSRNNFSAGVGYVPSEETTEHENTIRVSSFTSNRSQGTRHGQGHGHGHRGFTVCPEHGRALCQFLPSCCVHKPVDCSYCPPPRSCCCAHHAGDCCYCVVQGSFSRDDVPTDSSGSSASSAFSESSDDASSGSYVGTSNETTVRGSNQGSSHGSVQDSVQDYVQGSAQEDSIMGASAQGSVQSEVYKPELYDVNSQAQVRAQAQLGAQELTQNDCHYQVHQGGSQAQGQSLSQVFGQFNGQVQYPVPGQIQYQAQFEVQHPAQNGSYYHEQGQFNNQFQYPVQEQMLVQTQHFVEGYAQDNVQHNEHGSQHLVEDISRDQAGDHTQEDQYQSQNLTEDHSHGLENHEQIQQAEDQVQSKTQNEKEGHIQWADEVEEELLRAHQEKDDAQGDTHVQTEDHESDEVQQKGDEIQPLVEDEKEEGHFQWADEVEDMSQNQVQNDKANQVQQTDNVQESSQGHKEQIDNKAQTHVHKQADVAEGHSQGHQDESEDNTQNTAQAPPEDQPHQPVQNLAMGQPQSQSHDHIQIEPQSQGPSRPQQTEHQSEGNARDQDEANPNPKDEAPRAMASYTLKLLETGNYSDCRLIIKMPMNSLYPIPFPTHKLLLSRSPRLATLLDANKNTGDIEATTGDAFSMIKAFETALQNFYGAPYLTPDMLKVATADAIGYEVVADRFETLLPPEYPIHDAMADYAMCYLASGVFLGDLGVVDSAVKLAIHTVHPTNIEAMIAFALQPGRALFRSPSATVTPEAATLAANKDVGLDERLMVLLKIALERLFEPLGFPFKLYISARPDRTVMFPDRIPASLRMYPGSILANPKLAEVKFGSFASAAELRPQPEVERASGVLLALSFEALKIAFVALDERGLLTEEAAKAIVVEREARRFYALRVYAMFKARYDKESEQFGKKRLKKLKKENGIKDDEIKILGYREAIVMKDEKVSLVRDWIGLEAP